VVWDSETAFIEQGLGSGSKEASKLVFRLMQVELHSVRIVTRRRRTLMAWVGALLGVDTTNVTTARRRRSGGGVGGMGDVVYSKQIESFAPMSH